MPTSAARSPESVRRPNHTGVVGEFSIAATHRLCGPGRSSSYNTSIAGATWAFAFIRSATAARDPPDGRQRSRSHSRRTGQKCRLAAGWPRQWRDPTDTMAAVPRGAPPAKTRSRTRQGKASANPCRGRTVNQRKALLLPTRFGLRELHPPRGAHSPRFEAVQAGRSVVRAKNGPGSKRRPRDYESSWIERCADLAKTQVIGERWAQNPLGLARSPNRGSQHPVRRGEGTRGSPAPAEPSLTPDVRPFCYTCRYSLLEYETCPWDSFTGRALSRVSRDTSPNPRSGRKQPPTRRTALSGTTPADPASVPEPSRPPREDRILKSSALL